MCKRIFRALKIKMDNYHLRYALAGAEEEIEVLKERNVKLQAQIDKFNKQLSLEENSKQIIDKIKQYCHKEYYFDFTQTEGLTDNRCIELQKLNNFLDNIANGEDNE